MRRFQRTAFLVGMAVTAVVLGADLLGRFAWLEDLTVDLRLNRARWTPEPPGDQLRLVAIDDQSLDTIGRWPWPRERIATALEEVARAGAKVVAFDVLFPEPESEALGVAGDAVSGDRRLAEAMGKVKTVVALSVRGDRILDASWETPKGREQLGAFIDAAQRGVNRDIAVLLDEAKIEEPFRSRIRERPKAFLNLAAWTVLEREVRAGRAPADFEAFVKLMLGDQPGVMRDFGERVILLRAWKRVESWLAVQPALREKPGARGSPQDLPPIPELARAGSMFGVVTAEPDAYDARLRSVTPYFETDFGLAPQLGIAAALAYMDHRAGDAEATDGSLRILGSTHELRNGRLTVDWPTTLLPGYGSLPGDAVVSIGRLVELQPLRQRLVEQRARLREAGLELATSDLLGRDAAWFEVAAQDGRLRAELLDQWGENGYREKWDAREGADDPETKVAALIHEWISLDEKVALAERRIDEAERYLRKVFQGKLVFVGFAATGTMADMVNTIFDPRTPGVFSHVAVADMMLNDRSLRFCPAFVSPLAVVLLGFTAAVVAARFGAGAGFGALMLLLATYVGLLGVVGFDRSEIVYPMAAPVAAGFGSWIVATAAVAIVNQREKLRIQKQFRARVSPQLVDMLAENPKALSMQGTERVTTILFGDLAGFTSISEKLGGPDVVRTLNLYMGAMTRELTAKNAYVNKFLGDGLLAFWSAFVPEPRQCELAVAGAMACQRLVKEIGQRPERAGLPPITLRLGIATGKVVIGDCGAPPDLNDYTVIGDAVNLAARLESANKQFGTSILVDGTTAEAARAAGLPVCSLGRVVVVGQSVPVDLHEVCLDGDPQERIRVTERAVQCFARGEWPAARAAFDELQARFGGSKTANAFREAMDDPADRRDGVLRLRAK